MTSKEKLIEFLKSTTQEYIIQEMGYSGWLDIIVYSNSKTYFTFDENDNLVYIS